MFVLSFAVLRDGADEEEYDSKEEEEEEEEVPVDDFSLHEAIRHCQLVREVEDNILSKEKSDRSARASSQQEAPASKRKRFAKDSYFSDEEEECEG